MGISELKVSADEMMIRNRHEIARRTPTEGTVSRQANKNTLPNFSIFAKTAAGSTSTRNPRSHNYTALHPKPWTPHNSTVSYSQVQTESQNQQYRDLKIKIETGG